MTEEKELSGTPDDTVSLLGTIQRAALDPHVEVDKLRALIEMQKTILDSDAVSAFNVSMIKVQSEIPQIKKEAENRQTHSKYAKLEQIDKVITPIYTRNGFALMLGTDETPLEKHIRITCETLHEQGYSKHSFYDMPLDDKGIKGTVNKTLPHASASSITYGQRILKCLIFNIQLAEDIDGNIYINSEQIANIDALLTEVGADKQRFLNFMNADIMENIPLNRYDFAISALEKKRA